MREQQPITLRYVRTASNDAEYVGAKKSEAGGSLRPLARQSASRMYAATHSAQKVRENREARGWLFVAEATKPTDERRSERAPPGGGATEQARDRAGTEGRNCTTAANILTVSCFVSSTTVRT